MDEKYLLVFDEVILKQLKKLSKDKTVKLILTKMFDRIEEIGESAGKLLDNRLSLYEMKAMRPPIRLYYEINKVLKKAYIFEFEMKTNQKKQSNTISKLKNKIRNLKT
ncbi:MAG TPA: hypothetical protein VJK05_01310 [archaeon]|nr:hypothetical protein [archaeon]